MKWIDVAGAPGSGKSTLCYKWWGDKSVGWDGKLPPAYWKAFLQEITRLCRAVEDHPSFTAVLRMNDRSAKKMATVERMSDSITAPGQTAEQTFGKVETQRLTGSPVFIQTGLVQRVLGFGWRLEEMGRDIHQIEKALWLMPVSVGVAFLDADLETLLARNRKREETPATAHENRSHQVPLMLPSIALAKKVLHARGVPTLSIDVAGQSVDAAREALLRFASGPPCDQAQVRLGREGAVLPAPPPPWWRP